MGSSGFQSRGVVWAGLGAAALLCAVGNAAAQSTSDAEAEPVEPAVAAASDAGSVEEIVVTASRVQRAGFEAPTPVTVISSETLEKLGKTNIGQALAQFPAFQTDQSGATNSFGVSAGRNFANLRNLGSQRTLVLMDGQRLLPSAVTGQTDLNSIPQILVDRIDVVTGGASAQWGSDAVSGVVNMVTKKKFDGVNVESSYGVSELGDNREKRFGVVAGTSFADDRGHVVFGSEWVDNQGIGTMYTRDFGRREWGFVSNPAYTATNDEPRTLVMRDVRRTVLVGSGVIIAGPFAGTSFDANGQPIPFQYGSVSGGTAGGTMSGGQGYGTGDGAGRLLSPPVERSTSQIRIGYDLTPTTELYGIFNYGYQNVHTRGPSHGDNSGIAIRSGNPLIPDSMQQQMTEQGIASFTVHKFWRDDPRGNGLGSSVDVNVDTRNQYYTLGADGSFGDSWKWDTYAQYSTAEVKFNGEGYRITSRFNQAVDAVDDGNGNTVCRSTLTNPTDGCVPVNLLGPNSISLAAWNWMTGTQRYVTTYDRSVAAANLNGMPFSTWAGPVSVATGLEYRKDETDLEQTDPVALGRGYTLGNTQPLKGTIEVSEAYVESVVPLLSGARFARLIEFDGAVRLTDYSTSGQVVSWKTGLNYSLNDTVRLRGSVSRDIRAPNVSELFTSVSTGTTNIVDPSTGGNLTVRTQTSGNPDLDPERSLTSTAGIVFTPQSIPGLKLSADYYEIDVRDIISSVSAQQVFDYCNRGEQAFCGYITRISAQEATAQLLQVNLAQVEVKGIDAQVNYRFNFDSVPGDFDLNYFLTYQSDIIVDTGTTRVNRAGDMGTSATPYGGPKTKWNALLTYSLNRLSTTAGLRYVGSGKKNVENTSKSIDDNSVKSVSYVLLSASYDLPLLGEGRSLQLYGNVQNLLDKDPPVNPTTAEGSGYNATFHDVIGRTYMLGLRAKF
jgi:iron complex outermembrane receptor protein